MTTPIRLMCMLLAAAAMALPSVATAHEPGNAVPAIQGRHYIAFDSACPGVAAQLSDNLYPAWRAIDSAAQVLVDFKLDGGTISDVRIAGGHGDYIGPVRRAVRVMKCSRAGAAGTAVRFRIAFEYPEDALDKPVATRIIDEAPLVAER